MAVVRKTPFFMGIVQLNLNVKSSKGIRGNRQIDIERSRIKIFKQVKRKRQK